MSALPVDFKKDAVASFCSRRGGTHDTAHRREGRRAVGKAGFNPAVYQNHQGSIVRNSQVLPNYRISLPRWCPACGFSKRSEVRAAARRGAAAWSQGAGLHGGREDVSQVDGPEGRGARETGAGPGLGLASTATRRPGHTDFTRATLLLILFGVSIYSCLGMLLKAGWDSLSKTGLGPSSISKELRGQWAFGKKEGTVQGPVVRRGGPCGGLLCPTAGGQPAGHPLQPQLPRL